MDQPPLTASPAGNLLVVRIGFAALPVLALWLVRCSSFEAGEPTSDAGVHSEAGASAGQDWSHFACTASHDLCDDMDTGALAKNPPWKGAPTNGENQVSFTTADFVSPPRALQMKTALDDNYNASPQLVSETRKGSFTTLTCDVDLRIAAEGKAGTAAELIEIIVLDGDLDASTMGYRFSLQLGSQGSVYVSSGRVTGQPDSTIDAAIARVLSTRDWNHVHIEITPSQREALTLALGNGAPERVTGGVPFTTTPETSFTLKLKVVTQGVGWSVLFDNVVCDRN
jgi:hypothetical protein